MTNDTKQIKSGIYKKGEITFEEIINSIKNHPKIEETGSILSFTGIVRNTSKDGNLVKGLKIDAYDELANNSINSICSNIKNNKGIIEIKIIHLKGEFDITDDLVYVVIASAHRQEGFEALRSAVERYKKEIAVWKKEEFINGSGEWIH